MQFGRTYEEFEVGAVYKHWPGKTVTEYDEWGNPEADPAAYDTIAAYSPYDNVGAHPYPRILAETSLHDTRVLYVEPAKWVARLRETVTNDPVERPILLRTEMVAGHGGRSGRYDAWEQYAWELAFLMDQLGVNPSGTRGAGPTDGASR